MSDDRIPWFWRATAWWKEYEGLGKGWLWHKCWPHWSGTCPFCEEVEE